MLQIRENSPSLILRGGRLLQQYVVDNYVKIETQRLRWIRSNQRDIRSELYQGLQDCLHGGENHAGFQRRKKLTMMVIHNIFVPEDWSFTFFEGLNRHPDSILKYKTVTKLGCGNGWISIAIAEKWSHLKVYGLDINPRPVKISWINLYFNSLDENGQPIYEGQKKTLLDRVEFHEIDLLSYCRDKHLELDRIVGCIRQVFDLVNSCRIFLPLNLFHKVI
ncbi:methionine S-methyltransferase-like isoform X1 [Primulina eburnea]|uniref:methionine S-methyltransferase-like isoform X1 n=1 Tax=Primulina eburnea TaxID=1245227 RepID=UPI003C6C890C